uniref:Uridine kinase n=1 Tax=Candidatus Methanogaster sp. ANME-2c ERB4 TaxID=2759911 RepID=A0A7G9Y4B5_9EURY|nr:uridine kinase [Methanosarcinales archaeon ANME-2c ERB4]QNO44025.1 uridine kinase [Methanosarcinales archaeon ANME-2c ERB4]QNO50424.1 uridine kinase [Methanosarcinales archaeon ANME-2c ERB4]
MVSDYTSETVAQRIDALLLLIGDDLQSHHVIFREELKKTAHRADLVDVALWAEEGNGKVSCEIITVPNQIFEPGTDRYAKLLEYIAVCLNIRGETLGIRRIGIETRPELNTDRLISDVKEYFEREFFITLLDANFGKSIQWRKGRIEQGGIRIGQVRSGRYDQGRSVGMVVTGTDIKTVALESGNVVYRNEIAIEEGRPIEEVLEECLTKAATEVGISKNEDVYIGVPGPVDPYGNIVRIAKMKGVTRESLENLQRKYPSIRFINDANVEAVYHRIIWAGDIATDQPTVALVLRKGIGFAILVEGYLLSWVGAPTETHFRVNFSEDAPICNCGMKGCLELPSEWVVDRFMHLASERGVKLPHDFAEKVECAGEKCDLLAADVGTFLRRDWELQKVASDVFMEYGENLSVLFGELARLMDVTGFWVALSGGMVQQKGERAMIIQGIAKGIDDKFPGLKIEILGGIEEVRGRAGDYGEEEITRYERISGKWQGAVGAALCALQEKQMKMRIEPDTKLMIDEAEGVAISEIAGILRTGRKLSTHTIIGVAGPSGGGKTHFARLVKNGIEELGRTGSDRATAEIIAMDDYLLPKEKRERGGIRAKYSLTLLWDDIVAANNGDTVSHPVFDQVSRVRYSKLGRFLDEKSTMFDSRLSESHTELFRSINRMTEWSGESEIKLKSDKDLVIIIDGILALDNPTVNKLYYDYRIFVHASWIWRLCAAIYRAWQEKWYQGANTAEIIEKFVFKRPEEEAIINVTYLDADMMVENDYYELKVDSDLKNLLGEVYPLLDPDLCAQYYIIYAIMGDNGYDAKTIFKERLRDINELIGTSRIEDMYEEGAGRRLEEDICRMAESG